MDFSALDNVMGWAESRPDLTYRAGPTINDFLLSGHRRKLLRAPNQVGKTIAGAILAIRRSLEWNGRGPGLLGVMIADIENHYVGVCAKIAEVMPPGELAAGCKYDDAKGYYYGGRRGVVFKNGARWEFRGGEGTAMSAAGNTVDLGYWVDEIPKRAQFNEALRATNRWAAPMWVTLTPISRPVQWFRERVEGVDGRPPDDVEPDGTPTWRQWVPALSKVECPWMTDARIETIRNETDPDERPQRLEGAWEGPTSDRFFACMSGAAVVPQVPEGSYSRVIVPIDHGEGAGHEFALLLLWDGRRVVIADEYVNDRATTPEQDAPGIVAMLARNRAHPANVDEWVGDVNSSGKSGAGRRVNDDLGRAIGTLVEAPSLVRFRTPNKAAGSVDYGRRLLNYALGRGDLLVCERAVRATRALWHHREDGDEYTHAVDALRYGAVDLLRSRAEYAAIQWRVG